MLDPIRHEDADAAQQEPHPPDRVRCEFEHPFFLYFHRNGGGQFRYDEVTGGGAFVVRIGDRLEFTLPVPQLAMELGLTDADTPDSRRLRLAAEAVNFVESLELGAELPSEVVTGKASWSVPEAFLRAAKAAINDRVSDWRARGREAGPALPPDVTEALAALNDQSGANRMPARTAELIEEFAYILCLRHRFTSALAALRAGVGAAVALLTPQTAPGEAAAGLLRVIDAANKRLEAAAGEAEAELDNVIAALRDPVSVCARLTRRRNRLYPEVRRLEAASMPWRGVMPGRDPATKELIFRTYRQMGRRDLPADNWNVLEARLASALLPPGAARREIDEDHMRVWYQRPHKAKA